MSHGHFLVLALYVVCISANCDAIINNMDDCDPVVCTPPCENGGVCVLDANIPQCACLEGFTGLQCESDTFALKMVFNGTNKVKYPARLPTLDSGFTLCLWMASSSDSPFYLAEVLFSYSGADSVPSASGEEAAGFFLNAQSVYYIKTHGFTSQYSLHTYGYLPRNGDWHHVCLSWNPSQNGAIWIYVDGNEQFVGDSNKHVILGGDVYLGYVPGDVLFSTGSILQYDGAITRLNLWDTAMSSGDINNLRCGRNEGNLVKWSAFFGEETNLQNVRIEDEEDVCSEGAP
ncbi:C-reactive protein 1.4-like isoform X2 [Ptychodera flava]|uniref:C-reactive protein 1.4-like isoform X2 n=1 Tax=Ptychodera flava TaxID=63121 RepID=UPI003969ED1B